MVGHGIISNMWVYIFKYKFIFYIVRDLVIKTLANANEIDLLSVPIFLNAAIFWKIKQ